MHPTRYGKIKHMDLSDPCVWLDAAKDRYDMHGFWRILDARLVAWTFQAKSLLGLGIVLRVLFALLGSNRYEPFPVGNRESVKNLYKDNPDWLRWIKWHLRNPWCDLRKFYMGFGYATYVEHQEKPWGNVHWAKFSLAPFKIPFPEYECRFCVVGWQQRGILSVSV